MVLVGFGAAGSAGNASAELLDLGGALFNVVEDETREGTGDAREAAPEDEAHGVCPGFAPIMLCDCLGAARDDDASGGNILLDVVDQLACLLTAERDDCAVVFFNLSTRDPPCAAEPPPKDKPAAAPGSVG
jgi:hypothetical protein